MNVIEIRRSIDDGGAADMLLNVLDEPAPAEEPLTEDQQKRVVSVFRFIELKVNQLAPGLKGPARDDVVQAARVGVAIAARRFKEALGNKFITYAAPFIAGAILNHIDREGQQTRIKRAASAASAASSAGRAYLSEQPDDFKVIWDPRETNQARLDEATRRFLATMSAGVAALPPSPEDDLIDRESQSIARETVHRTIDKSGERAQAVYQGKYVEKKTMQQIADEHGVGLNTVRRAHDQLLDDIHAALLEQGITEKPPRGR